MSKTFRSFARCNSHKKNNHLWKPMEDFAERVWSMSATRLLLSSGVVVVIGFGNLWILKKETQTMDNWQDCIDLAPLKMLKQRIRCWKNANFSHKKSKVYENNSNILHQMNRITKSKLPALRSCRVVHSCCSAFLKTKTRQKTLILHISSADGFEFDSEKWSGEEE